MKPLSEYDCCTHALSLLTWSAMTSVSTGNVEIAHGVCEEETLGMECDERLTQLYDSLKKTKDVSDISTLLYSREGLISSLLNEMAVENDGDLPDPKRQFTFALQQVQDAVNAIGDANRQQQEGCTLCAVAEHSNGNE